MIKHNHGVNIINGKASLASLNRAGGGDLGGRPKPLNEGFKK